MRLCLGMLRLRFRGLLEYEIGGCNGVDVDPSLWVCSLAGIVEMGVSLDNMVGLVRLPHRNGHELE